MTEGRADDLSDQQEDLPQPGTEEPADPESSESEDSTDGPGNVSIDEPTAGALEGDDESPSDRDES